MQESCQFRKASLATAGNANEHRIATWLIKHTSNSAKVINCILKEHQVHLCLRKAEVVFAHLPL